MPLTSLPPYPTKTRDFLSRLVVPGELIVIAAKSGKRKTMFGLNLVTHALITGHSVGLVTLEMTEIRLRDRVTSMLLNVPAESLGRGVNVSSVIQAELRAALGRLHIVDFCCNERTASEIAEAVDSILTQHDCGLVFVDATEMVRAATGERRGLVEAIDALADIAHRTGVSIICTSQIKAGADDAEVVRLSELAFAGEKGHRAGLVAVLGEREPDRLDTLAIVKVRDTVVNASSIARLALQPSLRMEVLDADGPAITGDAPAERHAAEHIGARTGDFPETSADELASGGDANDVLPAHAVKNGYVQVGRAVAESPMFRNRRQDHIFWLLDLYFCAHFVDGAEVYAPRTTVAVCLRRGQYMATEKQLAERWNVSRKRVQTFLQSATREGLIVLAHVYPDGSLHPPEELSKEQNREPPTRACATVITLCHYGLSENSRKQRATRREPTDEQPIDQTENR